MSVPIADPTRDCIAALLLDRRGDNRPGLRCRDRTWTWDQVVAESAARGALGTALLADRPGVPPHIGVLLPNVADFVFWLGGAALAGCTVVGINPTRGPSDMAAEIRLADCQLIVTDTAGAARLRALGTDTELVVIDTPAYTAAVDRYRGAPLSAVVGADTLLLLLFTSGTTGAAKAVRCSQGRLTRIAYAAVQKYGHRREDVEYCSMPLFHGNAIMALWAPALAVGATVCLAPAFSASQFLPDVRHFGATFFTYVGKALGYLLSTPEQPDDADNPLQRGFGTEASPDDRAEFRRRFGAELFEGYGSSEGGGAVALAPDAPPGALGRPAHDGVAIVDPQTLKDCPAAVLDDGGRVLNPDEAVGEIVDKFGTRTFEGYYNNDEANAERIRHGWYWTGDLGYLDRAGFIYFAGRRGDWIRVDGENISALTIEHVLRRHPQVIAAAAFAVPDPRSGDQVMAAIEVARPDRFDAAEFATFLATQQDLGAKGAPRLLRVSADLPVTGSNKVLKRELQQQRWHTTEAVYRWAGRGAPDYRLMTEADRTALAAEFTRHGRQHHV